MTRWFEDIALDHTFPLGTHAFTGPEIAAFAHAYEPYAIHFDPDASETGIVASNWHVVAVGHRKMVERLVAEEEIVRTEGGTPGVSGPSPGVSAIRFDAPVRPGDVVRFTLTVTGKRKSNSIPGWGLLFNRIDAHNQDDALVYTAEVVGFSKLRDYTMPLRLRLAMGWAGLRRRIGSSR